MKTYFRLAETQGLPCIVNIQNPYTLLNRSFEAGAAEVAHRGGIGLLTYWPLAFSVPCGNDLGGKMPAGARETLFERFSALIDPVGRWQRRPEPSKRPC